MVKFLLLLIVCFSVTFSLKAQTYGNEWINYNQKYYAFQIVQEGIYKIDYATLNNAGIPLSSIQSANLQIFGREKEVPLYISDGGNGALDPGDYILFYAQRNDGWLDKTLYDDPNWQGNPAYSLYNDTIQYFVTWNSSTSNLRFSIETDINVANYAPVPFVLEEKLRYFNDAYHEGKKTGFSKISSSFYEDGEGWGSPAIDGAGGYSANYTISTSNLYTGSDAPQASFKAVSVSNSDWNGAQIDHHLKMTIGPNGYVIKDTLFGGYTSIPISQSIPLSELANGSNILTWSIVGDIGAAVDNQSLNYFSLKYPKTPNLENALYGKYEIVHNSINSKSRLDFANFTGSNPVFIVLGDEPKWIPYVSNAGIYSVIVPNASSASNQEIIVQDESLISSISDLKPVNGNGSFTNFLAMDIDSALLMVYHPMVEVGAKEYQTYRKSLEGGNYNAILANVEELYQQFGGGIPKHINGIRRYAYYIYKQSTKKPCGLFLMGKGVREADVFSNVSTGPGTRKNVANYKMSLIPSFGQPSSDIGITNNFPEAARIVPLIPTGRIAVQTNQQLLDYLDKVKLNREAQDPNSIYDTPNKDYQKQLVHFLGGTTNTEKTQIKTFSDTMTKIISSSHFGGNVKTLAKENDDPLDPVLLQEMMDRITNGVSIIQFFGHSSATNSGFEINIDEPQNWMNKGKNPIMIVNSCYNGNIFQNNISKSEEFVLLKDYGVQAYLGTVELGYLSELGDISTELYRNFSISNYGNTLGSQVKNTINNLVPQTINDEALIANLTQWILHGDPMIELNWHQKPEIEITESSVSFTPTNLDLTVDSIEMQLIVTNLGKSITGPVSVEIKRTFPNNNGDTTYLRILPKLDYKDTLRLKMPLLPNISVGLNNFQIRVDLPSFIDEQYDETNNNQISKTLFINIDGIQPVIPWEFAVVPMDTVTVKASTIDPIAAYKTYRFEIDTTDLFNSPELRYALVSGYGGVKEIHYNEWLKGGVNSPLICTDSTVYFWRVAIDEPTPNWRESSFQYIKGKEGWGQDHFFQFKKNGFVGIDYNRNQRIKQFGPITKKLECNVVATSTLPDAYYNNWSIDGVQQDYSFLTYQPYFCVGVVDPLTFESWGTRFGTENPTHAFGNFNDNVAWVFKYFSFYQNDATSLAAFQDMLLNQIPDSNYIIIFTPVTARFDLWQSTDPNVFNTFAALGSDSIVPGRPNAPMAFFCKKGDPNSVVEVYGQNPGENVYLKAFMKGFDNVGLETSTLIGPAAKWGNVYWKQKPLELTNADTTRLRIKAYDIAGNYLTQTDILFTANDSLLNLNGIYDATNYPYIKLEAWYQDTLAFSPAQMDRWHVIYQPLPEAAIDGENNYVFLPSDTLMEGQNIDFAVDIKNIYTIDMDSLLVKYWVEDQYNVMHPISYARQDSLKVGETLRDTVQFNTLGLGGLNSLWVEVNPYVNGSNYVTDQPEQTHFNNIMQIPFYVNEDDIHPILDVTFDGRHILNGDIISPNAEILVTLKDDNPFLVMDDVSDTTKFGIYLTGPNGVQTRIPFVDAQGNQVLQWIPANSSNLKFKIIYPGAFTQDGKYTLLVQGSDKSGNISGDLEYKVKFEVINESSITYMMNYPNPFSTSTRFAFTLTGNEVPDEIIIQIMTVTGKVVREITEDQIGPIYIGRNLTQYAWDGKDEFGDQLANGVYLYTVKAQINGEDIKHRESGADGHFKKEFGKMYLLR